jgi:hypothetical protein
VKRLALFACTTCGGGHPADTCWLTFRLIPRDASPIRRRQQVDYPAKVMELVAAILAMVVMTASVVAILALPLLRRNKWVERCRKGLCVKCGYDLRASSGRCPECGYPAPERPT